MAEISVPKEVQNNNPTSASRRAINRLSVMALPSGVANEQVPVAAKIVKDFLKIAPESGLVAVAALAVYGSAAKLIRGGQNLKVTYNQSVIADEQRSA
jgi:hypothetical protein